MQFIKLQLGCLIISLYIILLYLRNTMDCKYPCNKFFDAIMIVAPWAIFFDGFTAFTVNHLDTVPGWLNLTLHALFFVFMVLTLFFTFLYILDVTRGIPKNKFIRALIFTPFVLVMAGIFIFLNQLYYVEGKITNYSMGLSVYFVYGFCVAYFGSGLIVVLCRLNYIEKSKRIGILSILIFAITILFFQIIFPEILITSLLPTLLIVGFYITMEDPSIIRIKSFNSKMVMNFSTLVESKDDSTGGHIVRTKAYTEVLLKKMKDDKAFAEFITKDFEENMKNAAPMHDLGKIHTPEAILTNPGKLTPEEFEIMKQHAPIGGELIIRTFDNKEGEDFLEYAYKVARFHHEKWNGKGYPEGLKGKEIPLCARIMAVADVFDAVSSKRCYRDPLPLDVCFKIIEDGSGQDFDPDLVRLFLDARQEITDLYNKLQ